MARSLNSLVETTQPALSPFGILSSAVTVVEDHSEFPEWISGYTYETPDGQTSIANTTVLGTTSEESVVDVNDPVHPAFRFYFPFGIRSKTLSSTMGTTAEVIQKTAEDALAVATQKSIEREFWEGAIAKLLTSPNDNRYLAQSGAVDVTPTPGTAVKPHYGLALLEEALGNATIGSAGTIHTPISAGSALKRILHVAKGEDGKQALITPNGNTLVSGAGYTRVGPGGVAAPANQAWMYATGPVTILLSDVFIVPEKKFQAVDTAQNSFAYYGERYAGVTWSTANLYAVLVDLTADYA